MDRDREPSSDTEGPEERGDQLAGDFGLNAAFVEEIRDSFRVDPGSVHPEWADVFDGPPSAPTPPPASAPRPCLLYTSDAADE